MALEEYTYPDYILTIRFTYWRISVLRQERLPKKCGIYKITDCKTGKFYIGSSNSIEKRFWNHLYRLRRGTHTNAILQAIFNNRQDALLFSVVELCDLEEKYDVEQRYIDELKPSLNIKMVAFGMPSGPDHPNFGMVVSESTRAKLSKAQKGRVFSEDTRKKLSDVQKGRLKGPLSEETKRKISDSNSGEKAYWFGKKHAHETISKIRTAVTGHSHTDETKEKCRQAVLGLKRSEETKEKLRQQKLGDKNPMYGKKRSAEAIAATVAANTGKTRSKETRAKLKAAWDRRRAEGKVMTPEIRAKISATKAARKAAQNSG
jgi:group I intron endonuclease